MMSDRLLDAVFAALTAGVPLLIGALVALVLQWLRLRRARLRAERLQLPPSTDPPPAESLKPLLRPRRQRK